jgi:hypothetical protein
MELAVIAMARWTAFGIKFSIFNGKEQGGAGSD